MPPKGTSLLAALDRWHAKADGNCVIDYGFHMIISDVNETTLKEMRSCMDAGVNSFKLFMAYPGVLYSTDGEILLAMRQAADTGATIMMHAENGIAIDQLVARALAEGKTEPVQHGLTRPPELEGEAANRAITLAKVTGAPLYIVHMTAAQALDAVTQARDAGQNVFAETCPQYLYLSLDDLARPGFEGAKYVASPPLRPKEHQAVAVAWPAHQRPVRGVHRPLPVLLRRAEGAWARRFHQDSQRDAGRGAPDGPAAPGRGGGRDIARPLGRGRRRPLRPGCSGSTRARARSRLAATPTS